MATEGLITLLEPVIEEAREVISQALVVRRREHRPWFEFVRKFNLPKRKRIILEKRTLTNLLYYRVNYAELYFYILLSATLFLRWPSGLIALHLLSALVAFVSLRVIKLQSNGNPLKITIAVYTCLVLALSSYALLLALIQQLLLSGMFLLYVYSTAICQGLDVCLLGCV